MARPKKVAEVKRGPGRPKESGKGKAGRPRKIQVEAAIPDGLVSTSVGYKKGMLYFAYPTG